MLVALSDGSDHEAALLIPGANAALDALSALDGTEPGDVVLVQFDVPPPAGHRRGAARGRPVALRRALTAASLTD